VPSSALIESNSDISVRIPDSSDYPVGLLIGMDEPRLVRGLETIDVSGEESLYLTRYSLGWSLCGKVDSGSSVDARCHKIGVDECIREEFARAFEDNEPLAVGESVDDGLWRERVNSSLYRREDGKLKIGLPLRNEDVNLPYNYGQALGASRLLSLVITLLNLVMWLLNPTMLLLNLTMLLLNLIMYLLIHIKCMTDLIEPGIIEKVPANQIRGKEGKVFFLCHHSVYHKVKKRIRVVFDCSRKCRGVSLNDVLLQGPDLMNRLVRVLLRFRESPVAVDAVDNCIYVDDLMCSFQDVDVASGMLVEAKGIG
jgi:hypothetical protein